MTTVQIIFLIMMAFVVMAVVFGSISVHKMWTSDSKAWPILSLMGYGGAIVSAFVFVVALLGHVH